MDVLDEVWLRFWSIWVEDLLQDFMVLTEVQMIWIPAGSQRIVQ